ncbi:MAG TPA: PAS domain-containing protein [Salinimicrobium sp.]|nr:PAS domain-containing protein [Salinimicrobium sp.]
MEKNYLLDIFTALPFPCLVFKKEGENFNVVQANRKISSILCFNHDEIIGKSLVEVYPKDFIVPLLQNSFHKVLSTSKKDVIGPVTLNFTHIKISDHKNLMWDIENIPIKDENTDAVFILHVLKEAVLSDSDRNENEKDQQYEHFITKNPDGLYSLDLKGDFTSANEGIAEIAEVSLQELLKMNFLPFCETKDKEKIWNHFQEGINGVANTFEANFLSAKGNEKVLLISLMPIKINNEIVGTYGRAKDITNLRNSEKVLSEKNHFLNVNSMFMGLLLEQGLSVETLEKAFSIVGQTVKADRMYYFEAVKDEGSKETLISMKVEWTSENAKPEIDNPEMHGLSANKLQEIMGPLTKNLPFTAKLNDLPECELRDIFLDQQIKSMLLLPVFIQNDLYGFIGFDDCTTERNWSNDEINFLKGLAHNFTNAVEKRTAETALRQKEEALKRNEEKFKALVQEGSDLIGILDTSGKYLFVSDTSKNILGLDPQDMIGKLAFDFIHPDDVQRLQEEFGLLETQKRVKTAAFRFKDQSGNWRWMETTATNLLSDPAVQGIVVNSRDITTIYEQAKEIELINERYRLAAKATQDIIYDWDLETDEVIRYYRSLIDLFGYTAEEVDQRKFWPSNIHPDDLPHLRKKLDDILGDEEEFFISTEYRFKRVDGSYARVRDRGFIIRNKQGKAIRLIGASSDISELTAKEEALKLANQRFQLAMKATNEMIWDWNLETNEIVRNQAFEEVYKFSEETNKASDFWYSRIHPKDQKRVKKSLDIAMANPEVFKWKEEYRIFKGNGDRAYVIDRASMIRDNLGNVKRMVGAVLDVTESRRLLQEVKGQRETFKEIAWEQSHVVRAPLARLQGLLDLFEINDFEVMPKNELVENVKKAANEIDGIITGIVSRIEKIEVGADEKK